MYRDDAVFKRNRRREARLVVDIKANIENYMSANTAAEPEEINELAYKLERCKTLGEVMAYIEKFMAKYSTLSFNDPFVVSRFIFLCSHHRFGD